MKQKDLGLIAVVIIISIVIALVLAKAIIGSPKTRTQKAEKVAPITDQFLTPDSRYFNGQSIDPAQTVQIGNSQNPNPFSSSQSNQ